MYCTCISCTISLSISFILEDTLDELEKNGQDYTKAMETISAAIKKLGKSIGDREEMEENLDDLIFEFGE